ncbi:GATA-type zinc finger protein 1-like [Gigantopelta aegis]|uniref:GATA-type zinc finger protein 1-like n=1 Tax=Gigantopelta aegis TaxID=1735272 RepID=UPI001B88D8BA|nr:GATA-type zinc finger protein 1-like [Gigantopelta aegis]
MRTSDQNFAGILPNSVSKSGLDLGSENELDSSRGECDQNSPISKEGRSGRYPQRSSGCQDRLKSIQNERQPLKTITNLSRDNAQSNRVGDPTYSPKSRKRRARQTDVDSQESKENVNHQNGKRTRRKCANPQKSPCWWDPTFKGVTLWFSTKVKGENSQLCITSFFSNTKSSRGQAVVKRRRHRSDSFSEGKCTTGSSDEEPKELFTFNTNGAKACASCSTRRTPLWRDAEDGTPLCNACGIRYRKYRVRCIKCWSIPKKDSKSFPICGICGGMLRFCHIKKFW